MYCRQKLNDPVADVAAGAVHKTYLLTTASVISITDLGILGLIIVHS